MKRRRPQAGISAAGRVAVSAASPQQPGQDADRDADRCPSHEQGRDRLGQRVAQPGPEGQDATGRRSRSRASPGPGPRQHPERAAPAMATADDEQVQDELVRLAEQVDHELLGARRLERDDEVPDGDDRARGAGEDARQQLGATERRGARRQPGEGGAAAAGDPVGMAVASSSASVSVRASGTPRTNASPRSWSDVARPSAVL